MKIKFVKTNTGSRWFYGNFDLGILFDNHPRFMNVIVGMVFWRLVISVDRTLPNVQADLWPQNL